MCGTTDAYELVEKLVGQVGGRVFHGGVRSTVALFRSCALESFSSLTWHLAILAFRTMLTVCPLLGNLWVLGPHEATLFFRLKWHFSCYACSVGIFGVPNTCPSTICGTSGVSNRRASTICCA